jgi:hypothetical protein
MAPSLHCVASAISGPAHVPLHYAEVMFDLRDFAGVMRRFRQHALFMLICHLRYFLFPLWRSGAFFLFP